MSVEIRSCQIGGGLIRNGRAGPEDSMEFPLVRLEAAELVGLTKTFVFENLVKNRNAGEDIPASRTIGSSETP